MLETWKSVVGYEGIYEVSDAGRVRRIRGGMGATIGRILACKLAPNGYLQVTLHSNNLPRSCMVHRLVAAAFIGSPKSGQVINHKNFNKIDNTPANLEWVTQAQNVQHATDNGRHGGKPMPGESNGRSRLTAAQVSEIRTLRGTSGIRGIAKLYGVSHTTIRLILSGATWKPMTDFPGGIDAGN